MATLTVRKFFLTSNLIFLKFREPLLSHVLPGSFWSSPSKDEGFSGSFTLLEGGSVLWSGSITAPLQLQIQIFN